MAQTGYTPILLYSSTTAAQAPAAGNLTNSTFGSELAINITDGKLFYKDNANAVQVIAWKTTPTTAGGTGLTSYTAGDLPYYATGTTLSKLAIGSNGQVLTSTGTAPQWTTLSGVAVTTFSAGTTGFTPNSATSGAVTLAGTLITTNGGTGLSSYTAGDLTYYASGTTLTKLTIGASTTILTSTGTAPQWSAASGVTVGTATNLAGGVAGSVPYQTAAGTTAMLAIGVSGRWLGSSGTAPQWNAPAALTKTDDTNVTLTLGGSASTALLNAASITVGWTGTLATSRGGTGLSSFNANAIVYASSTSVLATSGNWSYDGTDVLLTGGNYRVNAGKGLAWSGNSAVYMTPEDNVQGARIAAGGSFKLLVGGGNEAIDVNSSTRNVTITAGNVIMSNGKGIDFSATPGTGTSELLDDYETGTWTPAYAFATPGTSAFTYTGGRVGTYTKVGNMVTCFFYLDNVTVTKGTASGALAVTSLPFTISGNTNYQGGVVVMTDSYPVNPQSFMALTGTTTANMRKTGGGSDVTAADFGTSNTVFLRGIIQYLV